MAVFLIFAVVVTVVAGIFDYFYIRRMAEFWGIPGQSKWGKRIPFWLTVLLVAPTINLFGVWAAVILHITGFAVLMELINVVVRKLAGTKMHWDKVYRCGLIPVLATVLVIGYSYWNMKNVRETDYMIYTQKEIREEGYEICLISDLHYPTTMNASELEKYCSKINSKKVDAVMLCGDIVDEHTSKKQMKEAFEILSEIEAEFGIYYVYGNHDRAYYSQNPPFTVEELSQTIENNGIKLLEDETTILNEEFSIVGRDDRSSGAGRSSSKELMEGVDQNDFLLLLDHQPVELEENATAGYDLQLSGHTHAGQMWPVGPLSTLFHLTELNYGYRKQGDFQVIVSSGIAGWGYPLRTGKHSEYVMIKILPE